jgi:hypothetical protein
MTIDRMNKLGDDGWELVSVASQVGGGGGSYNSTDLIYTFKRPKA